MSYTEHFRKTFGEFSRYCLVSFTDRFGHEGYLVTDAETPDECGFASVIRQTSTEEEAVSGL